MFGGPSKSCPKCGSQIFLALPCPICEPASVVRVTQQEVKSDGRCAEVLTKALELTGGDRAKQHGDKRRNHQNIADLWNAYFMREEQGRREPFTPKDVAIMMCLLKIARMKSGTFNLDNFIDLAGYAGVAAECSDDQ